MAAAVDTTASAGNVVVMQETKKRDFLTEIEKKVQVNWQQDHLFDTDPPPLPDNVGSYADFFQSGQSMLDVQAQYPKWFGTFPYAYMNGSFHLGHAFTISKVEFAAGFERMRGKRVLFPVGYHATGMPIKASADKLIREMEMFGENFERYSETDNATADPKTPTQTPAKSLEATDPSKAKKGKLNAKSTGLTYQFQILELVGVPREEIKKFADTSYWLTYFPPIAKTDMNALGARVDWRRQFVTSTSIYALYADRVADANPYYDSFVRWQMNVLRGQGRIKFGERYTIYSPKDGQPCMDHDRQSGEAVNPQEYTAVKMKVLEWGPSAPSELLQAVGGKTVYMVAATLRPETMYGQTNCFVGPNLNYGIFKASDTELFLITSRSARNMAYQGIFDGERGMCEQLVELKGADILGTKVAPPFGVAKEVYVLPMDGVLATKGTGVVTSVPSDSPDDYRTYMDLRKKPEHYRIQPEWAAIDPIAVLSTPKYGEMSAVTLCEQLKIQSQKDVKQLAEAKDMAYKEGFYNGTMSIGEFKGLSVEEAKPKVREQMIKAGLAVAYAEPESEVISRSADVCVVALVDQWYLDYGEAEWKAIAQKLLERMNTYLPETRNAFQAVLDWLNQWACARSFGLGSRLPWDPQFLVESLSDSTIYMSYYTIANLLHQDMFGTNPGTLGVVPSDMTDEMWSFVLGSGEYPKDSSLSLEKASQLKYHFQYFYPMDLRSSGKDLINNHLTFCLYIHAAIFPEHHWPQSMRTNGHLMLNGKKMSKSTGNFLTMSEATKKYGADATRLSLADAGDEITDANFEEAVANAAILRLYTAAHWAKDMKAAKASMRTGEFSDFDLGFIAEMDNLIGLAYKHFDKMEYKEALKRGLYDFEIARNWYRLVTSPDNGGPGPHVDLIFAWIRSNALMVAPFTPHFSEYIWQEILGETTSVQTALFPKPSGPVDQVRLQQIEYMRGVVDNMRSAEAVLSKKKGKAKVLTSFDPSKPKSARVYVATAFPDWQNKCVDLVQAAWNKDAGTINEGQLRTELDAAGLSKDKKAMPFCQAFKRQVLSVGAAAFKRSLPFSELDTLVLLAPYIKTSMRYQSCEIVSTEAALEQIQQEGESMPGTKERVESSEPGSPSIQFWNI